MAGRALLIGSDFGGLRGPGNDVAVMREILEARGFTVRECLGPAASRAGILAGYDRLVAELGPGDPAVVFYSGHGGLVEAPTAEPSVPDLMDMQFILPTDYGESADGDFRGITSVELTHLHARLREKTGNVVAVFDCCHAGMISRDPDVQVKVWPRSPRYQQVRAHLDGLRDRGALDRWSAQGSPDIVRIVACSPHESAYEHVGEAGLPIGVLTEGLAKALTEAGSARVAWSAVVDRARRHADRLRFPQRPEAEGPAGRMLFEAGGPDLPATLPVALLDDAGLVRLDGASLFGVRVGDRFAVMPPGASSAGDAGRIGDLTVGMVRPLWAQGRMEWAGTAPHIVPIGARAFPTAVLEPGATVRLAAGGPIAERLAAALGAVPAVRIAGPGEPDWDAEVRAEPDGTLTVADSGGPLGPPAAADTAGIERVGGRLGDFAAGSALLRLADAAAAAGSARPGAFGVDVGIEWGLVVDGGTRPVSAGTALHVGDAFYVHVHNRHRTRVFVSLVDIGLARRAALLSTETPSGREIAPGGSWGFGYDDYDGVWDGWALDWPEGVPLTHARPETLLLLVTSAPQDLSFLSRPEGAKGPWPPGDPDRVPGEAPLMDFLDRLRPSGRRDLRPPAAADVRVRYDVHALRFALDPVPRPGRFLVEARADPEEARQGRRGGSPMTLAVRLEELVVEDNHAVFGRAGVRVDVLVATGGAQGGYKARTVRFGNIRDGERLPFERMLMFHGKAEDYLDIAVWVTRDSPGGADLAELLAGRLGAPETRQALTGIGDAALDGSGAAVAAAVEAGALVVDVAARLLRQVAGGGDSIGLYVGSWLEGERFGLGRRPIVGRRAVQDFSIVYTVEEVD